jgi:hypothetical protein
VIVLVRAGVMPPLKRWAKCREAAGSTTGAASLGAPFLEVRKLETGTMELRLRDRPGGVAADTSHQVDGWWWFRPIGAIGAPRLDRERIVGAAR